MQTFIIFIADSSLLDTEIVNLKVHLYCVRHKKSKSIDLRAFLVCVFTYVYVCMCELVCLFVYGNVNPFMPSVLFIVVTKIK